MQQFTRKYPVRLRPLFRRGFTLVEMLVAVTLVLIMMTMFAQVFQMAGASISKMRGLAENDQRSRSVQTILKADLDKRTMRWVYPFAAQEDPNLPEARVELRKGFFYVSENDPSNLLDDVLHFTMQSTITARSQDDTPYYGQALTLAGFNFPNQPDADDALLFPNNTGQSTAVEVVYFVRNGNLYRRQLLLRQPLSIVATRTQPDTSSINSTTGTNFFAPTFNVLPGYPAQYSTPPGNGLGTFYGDFDYAAYFDINGGGPMGAIFLGLDSLENGGSSSLSSIANPARRYGFSPLTLSGALCGRPKEFAADLGTATAGNPMNFIGRYTLQESSDIDFQYPQGLSTSGNIPTHPTAYDLVLDNSATVTQGGGADNFAQGLRRGEDLLLANVHAFDIQVWDDALGGFINLGTTDSNLVGADYHLNKRNGGLSSSYGPRVTENLASGAFNAVYDSWHPQIPIDFDGDGKPFEEPPFRPLIAKAQAITGATTDIPSWLPKQNYNQATPTTPADVVFPSGPPGTMVGPPMAQTPAKMPFGTPFFYRCVQSGTSGGTTNTDYKFGEPFWPKTDGATFFDGTVQWEAVENRKPLKAVKITVRFIDVSTQQMRQVSIVHSLVD